MSLSRYDTPLPVSRPMLYASIIMLPAMQCTPIRILVHVHVLVDVHVDVHAPALLQSYSMYIHL